MRKDQYEAFVDILKRAAILTYKPKDTDFNDLALVLFEELAQYELSQIDFAVRLHTRQEKFFPTLADIIRRIEGTAEERGALAWPVVLKAIRYLGHSYSVAFPSPAYNFALKQMGGWIRLCTSLLEEENAWSGKQFERFFIIGDQHAAWGNEPGKIRVERYCVGGNYSVVLQKLGLLPSNNPLTVS